MARLTIGRQSAGFVQRGHPWIRRDRFTKGLERLKPGQPVTLVDERGKPLASALADPEAEVCARVYHRRADKRFDPIAAIERAWDRRQALHDDATTTVYRVVHGEGDFLPGLRVERYGSVFVMLIRSQAMLAWEADLVEGLQRCLAASAIDGDIVIKHQLDDLRRSAMTINLASGQPVDAERSIVVHENGVALQARPFGDLATGVYCDQRATRGWLQAHVNGARVCNLFAYTGAFSISALVHGAASAIDVDLAAPALAEAETNAALNKVSDRHRIAHSDCLAWLNEGSDAFDLMVCDPPTAARGGGGWVLRRDYPVLLQAAAKRLAPGGLLLAACNTLGGKPLDLDRLLATAVPAGSPVATPDLGEDLPQLKGFSEGRPFRLAACRAPN